MKTTNLAHTIEFALQSIDDNGKVTNLVGRIDGALVVTFWLLAHTIVIDMILELAAGVWKEFLLFCEWIYVLTLPVENVFARRYEKTT